jgi:hypothetical protein
MDDDYDGMKSKYLGRYGADGCCQSEPVSRKPVHDAIREYMLRFYGLTTDFQMTIEPFQGTGLYAFIKVAGRKAVLMIPAQELFSDMMSWEKVGG